MKPWSKFREIKAALDSVDIEGLVAIGGGALLVGAFLVRTSRRRTSRG